MIGRSPIPAAAAVATMDAGMHTERTDVAETARRLLILLERSRRATQASLDVARRGRLLAVRGREAARQIQEVARMSRRRLGLIAGAAPAAPAGAGTPAGIAAAGLLGYPVGSAGRAPGFDGSDGSGTAAPAPRPVWQESDAERRMPLCRDWIMVRRQLEQAAARFAGGVLPQTR